MGIPDRSRDKVVAGAGRGVRVAWLGLAVVVTAGLVASPSPWSATPGVQSATPQPLQLVIRADGGYLLDGKSVSRTGLAQLLRSARGEAPDLQLRIDAADAGDPQQLIGALALADRAGIHNVGSQLR